MEIRDIKRRLKSSLAKFFEKERPLIQERAHERAMCFRLGYYLQVEFDESTVDAEYDRQVGADPGTRAKKTISDTSRGEVGIFPDLLVHKRGIHDENLLAIELKKAENLTDASWDHEKLDRLAQSPYCYKVTAFVVVHELASDQAFNVIWGGASVGCTPN